MQMNDLRQAQIDLENSSLAEAQQKARERLQTMVGSNRAGDTKGGSKLIQGLVPELSQGLQNYLDFYRTVKKKPQAYSVIDGRDLDQLALSILYCMVGRVASTTPNDARALSFHLGKMLEVDTWLLGLPEAIQTEVYEKVSKAGAEPALRPGMAKRLAARKGAEYVPWVPDDQFLVGKDILNIVLSSTEIFEIDADDGIIYLTPDAAAFLAQSNEIAILTAFRPMPMLVPPRPWKSQGTGAYLTPKMRSMAPLVRTFNKAHRALVEQHIESGTAAKWLDSINTVQATPYAINRRVLEVQKAVLAQEATVGDLKTKRLLKVPKAPPFIELMDAKDQRRFYLMKREVVGANRTARLEAIVQARDLQTADLLAQYDEFYVPVFADFRGRVYPVPHFNYQRSDPVKALFQFRDGAPLGEDGLKWLMVHCANVGDFNKVSKESLQDRVSWVQDNLAMITAVMLDPMAHIYWWSQADKPWQFLAACFDLGQALTHNGSPKDYVSHIAVALDGSNSGLQHYSAALRAEEDAMFVNLIPSNKPADLYQTVADLVKGWVELDAAMDALTVEDLAKKSVANKWLEFGVNRKVAKRAAMTFAYSSAAFGMKDQLQEDFMKPLGLAVIRGDLGKHPFGEQGFKAAAYLAGYLYRAITQTVSRAADGMGFLKQIAGALAHESKPVCWTTPLGFPVVHSYHEWEIKRVDWWICDKTMPVHKADNDNCYGTPMRRVRSNIQVKPTPIIKKSKQKSAVAPNVIHSNDASHLLMSVLGAKTEGITAFQLIHDSFGTHAGDVQKYRDIIRETFVKLYTDFDIFQALYDNAWLQLSEKGRKKLPPVPTKGALDLSGVLKSDYAFA